MPIEGGFASVCRRDVPAQLTQPCLKTAVGCTGMDCFAWLAMTAIRFADARSTKQGAG
jgi:hypothetical protein